jgi:hypothetical protein
MLGRETSCVFRSSRRNTPFHPSIAGGRKGLLEDEYEDDLFPPGLEVGITDVEDDGIWAFHQNTFTGHRRTASLR